MIKPEVVDQTLGAGIYSNYQKVLDAFIEEQTRAYTNEKRYSHAWATSLKKQLQEDLAFAEKVDDDYRAFLERVSSGGAVNFTEGEKILDVYVLAVSVLTLVNDVLDDMFFLGFVPLLTLLAKVGLEREARELRSLLKQLEQELEKAKKEVKEAWAQLAINGAIAAALACAGPLGWLAISATGIGQIVADAYLGPCTSDTATWGSRGNTSLGVAVSAPTTYLQESSKVLKVLKPAGKFITVVGFAFDANEIAVGYRNVDRLKKLMVEVKAVQGQLAEKVNVHKATISASFHKLGELRNGVENRGKGWVAQTRQTLEDTMRRSGYRPRL